MDHLQDKGILKQNGEKKFDALIYQVRIAVYKIHVFRCAIFMDFSLQICGFYKYERTFKYFIEASF